jgi:hypothetical protein
MVSKLESQQAQIMLYSSPRFSMELHETLWINYDAIKYNAFMFFSTVKFNPTQRTKYQYTILDLLQKRIIFLHLEQFKL